MADPVQALREMRRVCRPGGIVAARESDYHGFVWSPAMPELDRWMDLYQRAARANGGDPDAGRSLYGWAHAAGFTEVHPSSSVWCFAEPDDRQYWGGMWADRILTSALSRQLLDQGLAEESDLDQISAAWRRWTDDPDGWISLLHAEIVAVA